MVEILGYIAACITTGAAIPQVMKVVKTKSTHDISVVYFIMLTMGMFLWLCYGVLIGNMPLIVANIVAVVLNGIILGYKIRYK